MGGQRLDQSDIFFRSLPPLHLHLPSGVTVFTSLTDRTEKQRVSSTSSQPAVSSGAQRRVSAAGSLTLRLHGLIRLRAVGARPFAAEPAAVRPYMLPGAGTVAVGVDLVGPPIDPDPGAGRPGGGQTGRGGIPFRGADGRLQKIRRIFAAFRRFVVGAAERDEVC